MWSVEILVIFAPAIRNVAVGTLTERLGIGLQNRVRRFESARYLQGKIRPFGPDFSLEVPFEALFSLLRKRATFHFAWRPSGSALDLFLVYFVNALHYVSLGGPPGPRWFPFILFDFVLFDVSAIGMEHVLMILKDFYDVLNISMVTFASDLNLIINLILFR